MRLTIKDVKIKANFKYQENPTEAQKKRWKELKEKLINLKIQYNANIRNLQRGDK